MKWDITYRVEENVTKEGELMDIFHFEVKIDDGNMHNFEYDVIRGDEELYISGNPPRWSNSPYSQTRRKKLRLASKVWQVGWYIPDSKHWDPKWCKWGGWHDITKHILENKRQLENYIPDLLAQSMYIKAKEKKFNISDVDIIVPVPNHCLDDNSCAVSISKKLQKIMEANGIVVEHQNLLRKEIPDELKHLSHGEKEEFYSKNNVYKFLENYRGINYLHDKKVMLVDDVITQGYAAGRCLEELANQGAEDLCFYSVATTKRRS